MINRKIDKVWQTDRTVDRRI